MKNGSPSPKNVPPDQRQVEGRRGEEIAAAFLAAQGFTLKQKNWRCRLGEIDLIVERDGEIRFVEVKLRYSKHYGHPEEAMTFAKRRHLLRAVEMWLHSHTLPKAYQVDVVGIQFEAGKEPEIRWIEAIGLTG